MGCGTAKLDRPAPAGLIYTGSYHRACRRAADRIGGRLVILSYALLDMFTNIGVMPVSRWRVCFTRRRLLRPLSALPLLDELAELDPWLDEHGVLDGFPFLIDPEGRYDIALNQCFNGWLRNSPRNTQAAVAYDLKKWLDFLSSSRGGRDREALASWSYAGRDDALRC